MQSVRLGKHPTPAHDLHSIQISDTSWVGGICYAHPHVSLKSPAATITSSHIYCLCMCHSVPDLINVLGFALHANLN